MVETLKHKIDQSSVPATAPSLPERPQILFGNTAADIQAFIGDAGLRQKVDAVLALTPEAVWACQQGDVDYLRIEDFYPENSFRDISEPMLAFQHRWAEQLDATLWNAHPSLREFEFKPAALHFFFLKVLIDQLFMRTFALSHFFAANPEARVYYFRGAQDETLSWELFFSQSVYLRVLPFCAAAYGVALQELDGSVGPRPNAFQLSLKFLKRSIPLRTRQQLIDLRSQGVREFLSAYRPLGGEPFMLARPDYDLGVLVREKMKVRTVPFSRVPVGDGVLKGWRPGLKLDWSKLVVEPFFREAFIWAGVDVGVAAQSRLEYFGRRVVPDMWRTFIDARGWLARRRPSLVGLACPWEYRDQSILHAARSLEIPTFTFQHGGFEGSCDYIALELTELRQADYRFVYGPGVEEYFQARLDLYSTPAARLVSVGSPRLDIVRKAMAATPRSQVREALTAKPDEPLMLYAPTSFTRNHNYLVCGSYPDVPYFEFIADIVDFIESFAKVKLVYKSFPSRDPDPVVEMIGARFPGVCVVDNLKLPALLAAAEVHMFDIASTGLLEALLTDKPVFVFSDARYVTLLPQARRLLEKRAVVSETKDEFKAAIRDFLTKGDFAPLSNPDDQFISAYGTYLNDGFSAERSLAFLERITSQTARPSVIRSACEAR